MIVYMIVASAITVLGLLLSIKDAHVPSYCDVRREALEVDRQERGEL